jgi:hypothetical protein
MIKIAISTNKNFYKLSLPVIIPSLIDAGIESKDIFVFNSGFDKFEVEVIDNITHYYLDHNSYEYSPLIEICDKELSSEYWFLIHDTCKVGPRFKELLYNIPDNKPKKISLKSAPAMSIGLYSYTYLLTIKDKLLQIKNTDYSENSLRNWKNWGVHNEDYVLWKTPPNPLIYNNNHNWKIVDYNNWYNTNTIRRTEYYESLDLYKNKSNWGQTNGHIMILEI